MFWVAIAFIIYIIYRLCKKEKPREDYIDKNGYERNGYDDRLTHRKVAYEYLYDYPKKHKLPFKSYDIHHKDGNKLNNSPDNLKILTRKEHKAEHGIN